MSPDPPRRRRAGTRASPPAPTRGVPGGWSDPWDTDPIDALTAGLHRPAALLSPPLPLSPPMEPTAARDTEPLRRIMTEAGCFAALRVQPQEDGHWVARVVAWEPPAVPADRASTPLVWAAADWPTVNGPSARVALDALEAEVRDLLRGLLLGLPPDAAEVVSQA